MRPPVLPGLFDPPIAPSIDPVARHCSAMGALHARERVARQEVAILALYRERGPLTDQEVADALGIDRTSVNARRGSMGKLVERAGTRRNPRTGITNTTWQIATGQAR